MIQRVGGVTAARGPVSKAFCVVLSLLMLGVWSVAGTPGTAGAAGPLPAPTGLTPNGGSAGPTPTLKWASVSGADHYQVTFPDRDGNPRTLGIWGTSYAPTDDFPTGPVSWSVAAVDASNTVGATATANFTNAAVGGPTLTCPAGVVNFPAQAPTLTWTPITGARTYTLLVSSSASFVPAATTTLTTQSTSYTLTKGVPDDQMYYAKVSATMASGLATGSSSDCHFSVVWSKGTTGVDDAVPAYLSPADKASVRDVQLEWSPLQGAARYEVQVSPNGDWTNNLLYDIVTDATVWSPAKTLDNGAYYWRVRGIDNQGNFSRWSDYPSTPGTAWQFTVTPLAAPVPTSPAQNDIVSLPDVRLSWNPVPGAGAYQVELSSSGTFAQSVTCYTTHTDWSPYIIPPMTPAAPQVPGPVLNQPGCQGINGGWFPGIMSGTVNWHVRAIDGLVRPDGPNGDLFTVVNQPRRKAFVSTWSPTQTFYTNQDAPTLTAPAAGAVVSVPTLKWTRVQGAVFYTVSVTSRGWWWDNGASVCKPPDPGGGSFRTFNTSALSFTPPLTAVPRPSSPVQCPIEVTWTVTPYSVPGNAGLNFDFIPGPTPIAQTFRWGGYASGTSATPEPLAPSPTDGATVSVVDVPTFAWKPVSGADHYQVWWYANPVLDTHTPLLELNSGVTVNNQNQQMTESFTPVQPLPTGTGAWRVVALDAGNNVIASGPKRTLTVTAPANVPPASIQFSSKAANGATTWCNAGCQLPATPLVKWQAIPGVTSYRVYIAQDKSFTNIVRTYETSTTSLRPVEALPDNQAGQSYFVSVQPVFADWYTNVGSTGSTYGNFGAVVDPTGVASFSKASSPISGTKTVGPGVSGGACAAPTQNSISDMPTFCWNGATPYRSGDVGAMEYHLQVSTTADFSNVIDQAWVDQPTYTPYAWPWNNNMDGGDGGYYPLSTVTPPNGKNIADRTYPDGPLFWRVQALDATGNPLTYSVSTSVTKASLGITLSSPANGSKVDRTPSLRWTSKTFAAQYEVQVAKGGDTNFSGTNVVFDQKTDLTAVTPSSNNSFDFGTSLPSGAYAWRVRSVDAGGQVGTWTTARTFTVQPTAPSLTSPANNSLFSGVNSLGFTWSPVAGAVTYRLLVSTNGSPTTNPYVNVQTVSTGWYFDRPPLAAKQYWTVQALDSNNQVLATSPVQSFTYDSTRPVATNLAATAGGSHQINLTWQMTPSQSSPITSVRVAIYSSASATTPTSTKSAAGTAKSYQWTGLNTNTTYWFTVTPVDANGDGTTSNRVSAKTNPGNTNVQSFVISTYNDFLRRNPSTSELNSAVASLGSNPSAGTRSNWLKQFAKSPTWVNAIVNQFYTDTLGRPGETAGVSYWSSQISSGKKSVATVAANFYASDEYFAGFGHGNLTTWVKDLYTKILSRDGNNDPSGVAYWVQMAQKQAKPNAYAGRVWVAYSFYQSQESREKRVTALYQQLLHRGTDPGGLAYWAGQILTKGDISLAVNLASSDEYYTNAHNRYPG